MTPAAFQMPPSGALSMKDFLAKHQPWGHVIAGSRLFTPDGVIDSARCNVCQVIYVAGYRPIVKVK